MTTTPSYPLFSCWTEAIRQRGWNHFHFIGIGGAGMCALAEILHQLGLTVSGSDAKDSGVVKRLRELGITVTVGHKARNAHTADAVVVSTAIRSDNPELKYAHKQGLPVIRRGQLLGELMRYHCGISISGSHGKTTTTSMLTAIFLAAKQSVTAAIGGQLNNIGTNACLGTGPFFIAEADESDASMLYQKPTIAVITNMDADHMDTYQHAFAAMEQAFIRLVNQVPFFGVVLLGIDNAGVQALVPHITAPMRTFGLTNAAQVQATDIDVQTWETRFMVRYPKRKPFQIKLPFPGKHNIQNALAAISVALFCGIEVKAIQRGLSQFQGASRRCQSYGDFPYQGDRITLIDDYAHHPTEIAATLAALKQAFPNRRLVVVYQLHRYTRTRDLGADFVKVLPLADRLVLMDIFAASEAPIPGVSAEALGQQLSCAVEFAPKAKDVLKCYASLLQGGDVLVIMGAGDISALIPKTVEWLQQVNQR